jgi:hypothetical protein
MTYDFKYYESYGLLEKAVAADMAEFRELCGVNVTKPIDTEGLYVVEIEYHDHEKWYVAYDDGAYYLSDGIEDAYKANLLSTKNTKKLIEGLFDIGICKLNIRKLTQKLTVATGEY